MQRNSLLGNPACHEQAAKNWLAEIESKSNVSRSSSSNIGNCDLLLWC